MPLTLTILSFKDQPVLENSTVTFPDTGGTIGRAPHNTLVLADPDRLVSRQHATITLTDGSYYVTDSSKSGILIEGQAEVLYNSTQQIFNGTRLKITDYEILVTIAAEQIGQTDFSFNYQEDIMQSSTAGDIFSQEITATGNSLFGNTETSFVSHEELIPNSGQAFQPAFESQLTGSSPLSGSYIPPKPIAPQNMPEEMPETFNFEDLFADTNSNSPPPDNDVTVLGGTKKSSVTPPIPKKIPIYQVDSDDATGIHMITPPPVRPAPPRPEARPAAPVNVPPCKVEPDTPPSPPPLKTATPAAKSPELSQDILTAFLRGAGIHNVEFPAEQRVKTMHRIGQMFKTLVDGTVVLLRSRAELKRLFRADMTVIQVKDNNPLKFIVSNEDVLRQLLENKTTGFLDSAIAIEEGFRDIADHQLAMQAGIQASLKALLQEFDPKRIEKQFEHGLVLQKKSKCWDKFNETYQSTVSSATENFFGDAFIEAYEAQMKRLFAARNKK